MGDTENTRHHFFMTRCIVLALMAKQRGESPVGSIVVKDGNIIGEGIEAVKANSDITFHAEIEAIRRASKFVNGRPLENCVLYTTHEPCIMCSYMIRQANISTVVIGLLTEDGTGGLSSPYALLLDTGIRKWGNAPTVITGVMQEECKNLRVHAK